MSLISEGTNKFVDIDYAEQKFLCTFLDPVDSRQSDIVLSCYIEYAECQQMQMSLPIRVNGTTMNHPSHIFEIKLFDLSKQTDYCYIITASNNFATVKVEGTFFEGKFY